MKYVLLLLWDNRQVPLYGVPKAAIEGIQELAASNPAHPAHRPLLTPAPPAAVDPRRR